MAPCLLYLGSRSKGVSENGIVRPGGRDGPQRVNSAGMRLLPKIEEQVRACVRFFELKI